MLVDEAAWHCSVDGAGCPHEDIHLPQLRPVGSWVDSAEVKGRTLVIPLLPLRQMYTGKNIQEYDQAEFSFSLK